MKLRSLVVLLVALALAGCAAAPSSESSTAPTTKGAEGAITVFAAASLRDAFEEIGSAFSAANPSVTLNPIVYDGSSVLVTQITEGATADVLATADERTMQPLVDAGLTTDPVLFASNTLVVAVPAGNPAGVRTLGDLADVTTVLCTPEVPCGAASQRLLKDEGVTLNPASLEQNVAGVFQKISANEADAGLVYATDVRGEASVESFVPSGAEKVVNRYPIAATITASEAGRAFIAFVLAEAGQDILSAHGFGTQ